MRKLRRTRKSDVTTTAAPKPAFELSAFYEKILDLRRTNRRDFDSLSPVTKQALYAYEVAKREAARLQAIRDEPEAA